MPSSSVRPRGCLTAGALWAAILVARSLCRGHPNVGQIASTCTSSSSFSSSSSSYLQTDLLPFTFSPPTLLHIDPGFTHLHLPVDTCTQVPTHAPPLLHSFTFRGPVSDSHIEEKGTLLVSETTNTALFIMTSARGLQHLCFGPLAHGFPCPELVIPSLPSHAGPITPSSPPTCWSVCRSPCVSRRQLPGILLPS
jgi:hypothetical protein